VNKTSVLWVSGWAIPPEELAQLAHEALPHLSHYVIHPDPQAITKALASKAGILGGFSFGAHLLLSLIDPRPRILLAPFVDLKKESCLGGAIPTTQLRQQLRWLKRDPQAAIADFRKRIEAGSPSNEEKHHLDHLAWGLEKMLSPSLPPVLLSPGSVAVAGNLDPLLDAAVLQQALPQLHRIDSGHQLKPLLAAAATLRQNEG